MRFKRPSGVWFFYGRRNHRRFSWNNIMELTDRNVINVLSELAPYIEADGGYLEFVEIDYMNEGAFVKVRLGGACSSCAMSSQTLKMGIERKLLEEFEMLEGVIQVL